MIDGTQMKTHATSHWLALSSALEHGISCVSSPNYPVLFEYLWKRGYGKSCSSTPNRRFSPPLNYVQRPVMWFAHKFQNYYEEEKTRNDWLLFAIIFVAMRLKRPNFFESKIEFRIRWQIFRNHKPNYQFIELTETWWRCKRTAIGRRKT